MYDDTIIQHQQKFWAAHFTMPNCFHFWWNWWMLCELLRLHGLGLSEIYLVICDLKGCSFCYECWKHKVTHLDQGQYCPIHVSCLCSCYIDPHPKWITMKSMIAHQHRVWAHKYCIVSTTLYTWETRLILLAGSIAYGWWNNNGTHFYTFAYFFAFIHYPPPAIHLQSI